MLLDKNEISIKINSNVLTIDTITHLVKYGDYTKIYTEKNEVYNDDNLLHEYENELSGFGFIKANNKTLVNIGHIDDIYFGKVRGLMLKNNIQIKISRRKVYKFKELTELDKNTN